MANTTRRGFLRAVAAVPVVGPLLLSPSPNPPVSLPYSNRVAFGAASVKPEGGAVPFDPGAPMFSYAADANTGFYRAGDQLGISVGGSYGR